MSEATSEATWDSGTSRTPEQIEADLAATRLQLTSTVDTLVAQLRPSHQIELAKNAAQTKATEILDQVKDVADRARQGDTEALKQVGYVAAGVTGVLVLRLVRRVRRRRAQ